MSQAGSGTLLQPLRDAKHRLGNFAFQVKYTFPNLLAPSVPLSDTARQWLEALRRDGIVRIEDARYRQLADYLDRTYFSVMEQQSGEPAQGPTPHTFIVDFNRPRYREGGTEIYSAISFKDPELGALFFDPDITGMLYNYYQRQPYYRNQPMIQKISYAADLKANTNGEWHVDHLHQVSFMLLVTDVTDKDTHMEYCMGTHRTLRPIGTHPDFIKTFTGKIFHATGPKGTLFIFDAQAIHRAHYQAGSSRKILHLNITTGHHIQPEQRYDARQPWPQLDGIPLYSQRMIEKVVKL